MCFFLKPMKTNENRNKDDDEEEMGGGGGGGGGGGTRRHGSFNRVCWGKKTRRAKGKSGL